MTKNTHQTAEIPIYSIPFSIVGHTLLLTLSTILIFFNETNQAVLNLAYITLFYSFFGIIVFLISLAKTKFKTTSNEETE